MRGQAGTEPNGPADRHLVKIGPDARTIDFYHTRGRVVAVYAICQRVTL